ncbi:MAG: COG4705 family protein [Acetobacteraceae bacterium]
MPRHPPDDAGAKRIAREPLNRTLRSLVGAASDWIGGASSAGYSGYDKVTAGLTRGTFGTQVKKYVAWVGTPQRIVETAQRYAAQVGGFAIASLQMNFNDISLSDAEASMRLFGELRAAKPRRHLGVTRPDLQARCARAQCERHFRGHTMSAKQEQWDLSKVPEVTIFFWIIKIAATTLGETGGDTVSMTLNWGYLAGCGLFVVPLVALIIIQTRTERFHSALYWATIVAATLFGTTAADFFDRAIGIGYTGGSLTIFACMMATLALWYWAMGTIAVETVTSRKAETFYWIAITFSQTLGTALGDWTSNVAGFGFAGGAIFFVGLLIVLAGLYYTTNASRVFLFWAAFILTRPLGATFGDLLDKPLHSGGFDISRPVISACLAGFMVLCVLVLPQRAGRHPVGAR